jgi:cyclase
MKHARMLRCSTLWVAVASLASATCVHAQSTVPASVPGLTYRFEKVAEGVFCAIARGTPYYVSNSVVIVGDDSVLVVDTGAGPGEARVLRDGIRSLTDRPIRYVVDTHFHFDHAYGHQAFPDALILGHEATRRLLGPEALHGRTVAGYLSGLPAQIERARAEAAKEASTEKRAELIQRAAALETYRTELASITPTAPQVTFNDRMTIFLGSREVGILHLGRGHTAGDVVVILPRERIICTGDLFNGTLGFMGDAFVDEWADCLDRLAKLEFDMILPGHGEPFRGKEAIAPVQACLRELWQQTVALKRAGIPSGQAAARIDLRKHAAGFPRFKEIGFDPSAVARIYEVIDERNGATARP